MASAVGSHRESGTRFGENITSPKLLPLAYNQPMRSDMIEQSYPESEFEEPRNEAAAGEKDKSLSEEEVSEPPEDCSNREYSLWVKEAIKDMDVDTQVEFFRRHPRTFNRRVTARHTADRPDAIDQENIRIAKLYDDPALTEACDELI